MKDNSFAAGRSLLKSRWPELSTIKTAKANGLPSPPLQDPASQGEGLIRLPIMPGGMASDITLVEAMAARQSRRHFPGGELSLDELSFLLWATQGVRKVSSQFSLRSVPSGGARHPLETYLFIKAVHGLDPGLYRYLPLDHALILLRKADDPDGEEKELDEALLKHNFGAAVTFLWVGAPERGEWSYAFEAHRLMLIDAGHICQNLYLACEATGCGTCAVGAYDQEKCDRFLGLDGKERFLMYAAPVGKRA